MLKVKEGITSEELQEFGFADCFAYGQVEISHRLNINKPINHERTMLTKCIRMGLEKKYHISGDNPFWEIQIVYKDNDNKSQCGKYKLDDYCVKILHKGDMQIDI